MLHNVYSLGAPAEGIGTDGMYVRMFRKADQTLRFTITTLDGSGWEIREEQDSRLVRRVRYSDWHRVERARLAFSRQAVDLEQSGWVEALA